MFYSPDPNMSSQLDIILKDLSQNGRPGLQENIGITWVSYESMNPEPLSGKGASWSETKLFYPASIVKIFYAVAIENWLQKDILSENNELRRAMKEMICNSSNDATSLIIDLLTGTTSGPSLTKSNWENWKKQRLIINEWFKSLKWNELEGINCCQKTWSDGPFGRDKDFYGIGDFNRNSLTTLATGKLFESIMTNDFLSPSSCKKLKSLLSRSIEISNRESDPDNQVDGFLGEGLSQGSKLWSKAGLMSQARNDAAWIIPNKEYPMLIIVFTKGKKLANDNLFMPELCNKLIKAQCSLSKNN